MRGTRLNPQAVEFRPDAQSAYFELQPEYRRTLVAPQDDMWATFADMATHHALIVGSRSVGCCSLNADREIAFFFLDAAHNARAEPLFRLAIERLRAVAAVPSTVDPTFLALSRDACEPTAPTESKAILYAHSDPPTAAAPATMRPASAADHSAAVNFADTAAGLPRGFVEPYFAERIARTELFLVESDGEIVATGECRADLRQPGHGHLGLVVGEAARGKGVGKGLMHALVAECRRRGWKPLCSTEPKNLPARAVIRSAGFREYHRVLRFAFTVPQQPGR